MKLKTCLQIGAIFPIIFAIAIVSLLEWRFKSLTGSNLTDIMLKAGLALLGIAMAAVIMACSRTLLAKIRILNEWSNAVLKGELEPKVKIESTDDEIGRLSDALSRMLRELKASHLSLQQAADKFKQEASHYKKSEQTSQLATRQLADSLYRMKESQPDMLHKERMRVMEQVVRGVAHDLNDAITPIMGISELLLAHPEQMERKDAMRRDLETVHAAAQRAAKTLRNMAGFFQTAKEHAGPADVNRALVEALDQTKPRWLAEAQAAGVAIQLRTEMENVPSAMADESELRDVVMHLILNAVEAMPAGGILTLSSHKDKTLIRLQVKDSGQGMTPEVVRRCLEPFYSTKTGEGKGMGLTIASSVARRYGGDIAIESQPGKGTQVSLLLPVWANPPPAQETPVAAKRVEGLRIMIVDDNLEAREIVAAIVRSKGYVAEVTASGQECLEKIGASAFDVAIVDWAMPEMGGDKLAAELKKLKPAMPVIMLTGFGDIMIGEGNIPQNVDLILPKPVSVADLQQGVLKVLGARRA